MRPLTLIALIAALATGPALAQGVQAATCGSRDEVTRKLAHRFGEMQQGAGVVSTNQVLELWSSDDGSWTILMTRSDGVTCIMAAGSFWRDVPKEPRRDPA